MGKAITILNFHGIGEPHDGVADDERPYWISRERFVEILARADAHPRARQIVFTFDDGNRSDLEIAAPLLKSQGRSGAFHVLAGRLEDPRYLSRADCRALVDMGMEVGLHGRHHVDWRRLDDTALADEVDAARAEIAAAAGRPVTGVGVPFGGYDRRVMRFLKARGFAAIRTSDGGIAREGQQIQNRTSIRSDMAAERIAALLDGTEPATCRLRRTASTFLRRHVR